MQNSERIKSWLARIASLILTSGLTLNNPNDLIYNFSILNFHLINSSCSAAVDRVRNYSGKLTLPLLRQEDPPVVLAQGLTEPTWGDWLQSILVSSSKLIGLPHPLVSVSWGNMAFHVSKLWHGEINGKKGGGGDFENFWVFSSPFCNSSWNIMSVWQCKYMKDWTLIS